MATKYITNDVLFLVLLGFSEASFASNWKPIPNTVPNSTFVDASSIAPIGKYRKAWFLSSEEMEKDGNAYTSFKKYRSTKSLNYYSCEERTTASLQRLFYSESQGTGEYLGSWAAPSKNVNYLDVAPDTVGEAMLEYVCNFNLLNKKK